MSEQFAPGTLCIDPRCEFLNLVLAQRAASRQGYYPDTRDR